MKREFNQTYNLRDLDACCTSYPRGQKFNFLSSASQQTPKYSEERAVNNQYQSILSIQIII